MSSLLVNKIIDFIQKNYECKDNELLKIKYGIKGVYLTLSKTLIITVIAFILNFFEVFLLTLISFNILRFFAFGLHTKKSWQCLILSIILFNILPFVFKHINISNKIIIIVGLISLFLFLLYSPSDTEKRPLTNKKKRIIRKILSIICLILFLVIALKISYLRVPLITACIIEDIVINPFSYKILGLPYLNYKNQMA